MVAWIRTGLNIRMYALKHRQPAPGTLEAATQRLHAALDALSAAVERRKELDRQQEVLLAQLHAMNTDRARLANELDVSRARVVKLGEVGLDVTRRLDLAMSTIRNVLTTHGE